MTAYTQCTINTNDEVLIALLSEYEFEAFEENQDHTIAYIPTHHLTQEIKAEIENVISERGFTFEWQEVEDQNWNEVWESNFQPIQIDQKICVRADFHPSHPDAEFEIIINPKMAFGTGHHATTYMMLETMYGIDFENKTVFDYGCGTGILAIYAAMKGAASITAVDIEHESFSNTVENASINHIKNISAFHGTIASVSGKQFDIILANINRNVLTDTADQLTAAMHADGDLLLSGVLLQDKDIIASVYAEKGLYILQEINKDGWLCLHLRQR